MGCPGTCSREQRADVARGIQPFSIHSADSANSGLYGSKGEACVQQLHAVCVCKHAVKYVSMCAAAACCM
jgi:hypothetical protein